MSGFSAPYRGNALTDARANRFIYSDFVGHCGACEPNQALQNAFQGQCRSPNVPVRGLAASVPIARPVEVKLCNDLPGFLAQYGRQQQGPMLIGNSQTMMQADRGFGYVSDLNYNTMVGNLYKWKSDVTNPNLRGC